jgi:hypothetical protein
VVLAISDGAKRLLGATFMRPTCHVTGTFSPSSSASFNFDSILLVQLFSNY